MPEEPNPLAPVAPEPTTPTVTPSATLTPTDPPTADEPLREPGVKALAAERAARSKAESDLAALRKEIEDSKLSAEQKAAADLKAAQDAAATSAAKALRYEVAAEHGIPLTLAARLTGTTREEIERDAETFKTLIPAGATPPVPRIPAPDPGQGPRPATPVSEDDQIYEAIYGSSR
ncbi:MAG: hypothetical protein ABWX92_14065 [Mycetocola sp.]